MWISYNSIKLAYFDDVTLLTGEGLYLEIFKKMTQNSQKVCAQTMSQSLNYMSKIVPNYLSHSLNLVSKPLKHMSQ